MEQDRLEQLHQQASEAYLGGDFAEARVHWEALLELNPEDGRAQEGIRLCKLLLEGEPETAEAAADDPSSEDGAVNFDIAIPDDDGSAQESSEDASPSGGEDSGEEIRELLSLARAHLASGRAQQAEEVCRAVLDRFPGNADANEILAQCSGISATDDHDELDEGLSVLDIGAPAAPSTGVAREASTNPGLARAAATDPSRVKAPPADAAPPADPVRDVLAQQPGAASGDAPDPERQATGIDFGDLSETDALPLAEPVPVDEPRRGIDGLMQQPRDDDAATAAADDAEAPEAAADAPEASAAAPEAAAEAPDLDFSLGDLDDGELVETPPLFDAAGEGAADVELTRRVSELMEEADTAHAAGNMERARSVLSRLLILDESHEEANDLLARIGGEHEPDDLLGDFDTSDLVAPAGADGSPAATDDAVATPEEEDAGPFESPAMTATLPAGFAPSAPRSGKLKWVVAVVLLLGLAGGAGFVWWSRSDSADRTDGPAASGAAERGPASEPSETAPPPAEGDGAAAGNKAASDLPGEPDEAMRLGGEAMEQGNYARAVVMFNHVLSLDAEHVDAQRRLLEAGEKYQEQRENLQQFENANGLFEEGDYASGLRLLYRIPEGIDDERLLRGKVAGWYNMGVTALKAGECEEALAHLAEALALAPEDAEVIAARKLAEKFLDEPKAGVYYRSVEPLEYRSVD